MAPPPRTIFDPWHGDTGSGDISHQQLQPHALLEEIALGVKRAPDLVVLKVLP